jgi:AcrR family transcriptional regulator
MTPETSDRRRQRLGHILAAAARVFREKGYDGASVRDISRASGVSLSSLYYYCESKQKLLYLIAMGSFRTILQRLENRLRGLTHPVEKLRMLVFNHLEYFLLHPDEMKVLVREEEALRGRYRREVAEVKRQYFARAVQIFEELGQVAALREPDARVAVLALFGMMNWTCTWYRPGRDPSPQELADRFVAIFLQGVLRDPVATNLQPELEEVAATGH